MSPSRNSPPRAQALPDEVLRQLLRGDGGNDVVGVTGAVGQDWLEGGWENDIIIATGDSPLPDERDRVNCGPEVDTAYVTFGLPLFGRPGDAFVTSGGSVTSPAGAECENVIYLFG
jgi:hypothetical protein